MSNSLSIQVLGYQMPTVLPAPAGVCVASADAPRATLRETGLQTRAQRLLNVMQWARTTLRPASKSLKVFVAPEAYFRRFVASPNDPNAFDETAGLGHYDASTPTRVLQALTDALGGSEWDDWLLVVGCEAWADAQQNEVASDLLIVAPASVSPRGILLREVVSPTADHPYTLMQALRGDLPRPVVVRQRSALNAYLDVGDGLLAFESTLGHEQGALRSSLQGLATALGRDPNPGLQVVCSIDRDLDPAEVVASPKGFAAVNDGMFARDANDALALDTAPRFAVSEVTGYVDSIAQLSEQRATSTTEIPAADQLTIPVPGYTAKQSIALFKPMSLPVRS